VNPFEPNKPACDLRAYLEGAWGMARSIDDRMNDSVQAQTGNAQNGRFTGRAIFMPDGDGLDYLEKGRLKTATFDDNVYQSYRYRFLEPYRALVCFTDGRVFHDLDLRTGIWRARHLCDPDTYDGEFELLDWDTWRSTWKIQGPRKDMTIQTTFNREKYQISDLNP